MAFTPEQREAAPAVGFAAEKDEADSKAFNLAFPAGEHPGKKQLANETSWQTTPTSCETHCNNSTKTSWHADPDGAYNKAPWGD